MTKPPMHMVSRFMSNPSKTGLSLSRSQISPRFFPPFPSATPTLQHPQMVRANMGRGKFPPKPLFATISSKSELRELLFPEDGEGHTTNPLQETPHLEKTHKKKSGSAGWNFQADFWTWWDSLKTWEFELGVQEGFCGIQEGLKASPVGSNPLLIHIFGSHFPKSKYWSLSFQYYPSPLPMILGIGLFLP